LLARQTRDFFCGIAARKKQPDMQMVEWADAGDAFDEFARPSWLLMLWLVDVWRYGERTELSGRRPYVHHVSYEQFRTSVAGEFSHGRKRSAGARCPIMG
jgi:hypothetical protein